MKIGNLPATWMKLEGTMISKVSSKRNTRWSHSYVGMKNLIKAVYNQFSMKTNPKAWSIISGTEWCKKWREGTIE